MARTTAKRGRCASVVVLSLAGVSGGVALTLALPAAGAFADTPAYELYCPKTPVGDIVLNNVVTSGTISPASPAAGSQFNVTNWQTTANVPQQLASASAALGNSALAGSATAKVDAEGATPASIASPTINFSSPLASPIPAAGITLKLPDPPTQIGPFTASGGAITIKEDQTASLTLLVSGSPLTLSCTAYPNNSAQTGIVTSPPTGSPMSPTIASTTATGGSSGTTTPTTAAPAATPTTVAPATSAGTSTPSTTAMTGPAPHLWIVAVAGVALLGLGVVTVTRPRRRLRRAVPATGGMGTGAGAGGASDGEPPGLWLEGWGPDSGI